MKNIAVFFGGMSVEHDVSVITGVLTVNSLDGAKYNGVPIYVHTDGKWYTGDILKDLDGYKELNLKNLTSVIMIPSSNSLYAIKGKGENKLKKLCDIACAINCMHGERGEDGSLAGLLKLCSVPFASPSLLASSISIDKSATKIFLKGIGVKTVKSVTLSSITEKEKALKNLNFPMIVKPNCGGSSIGITVAKDEKELSNGINYALRFGTRVIVENALENFSEINCAAYRNEKGDIIVSLCEKPLSKSGVLTFDDKYVDGDREFPANIPQKIARKIQTITAKVYDALSIDGVIRIDYFLQGDKVYLNEINSVPGSLAYYLFCDTLKEFSKMLTKMVSLAEISWAAESTTIKKYSTKILSFSGSKGAKHL